MIYDLVALRFVTIRDTRIVYHFRTTLKHSSFKKKKETLPIFLLNFSSIQIFIPKKINTQFRWFQEKIKNVRKKISFGIIITPPFPHTCFLTEGKLRVDGFYRCVRKMVHFRSIPLVGTGRIRGFREL